MLSFDLASKWAPTETPLGGGVIFLGGKDPTKDQKQKEGPKTLEKTLKIHLGAMLRCRKREIFPGKRENLRFSDNFSSERNFFFSKSREISRFRRLNKPLLSPLLLTPM